MAVINANDVTWLIVYMSYSAAGFDYGKLLKEYFAIICILWRTASKKNVNNVSFKVCNYFRNF